MTINEAKEIVGDRAKWELLHMKRALSMLGALNTQDEDRRLDAVNALLKGKRN